MDWFNILRLSVKMYIYIYTSKIIKFSPIKKIYIFTCILKIFNKKKKII